MAVELKSTLHGASDGVKILVFGESGAGKTWLNRTLENPIILSTEKGLLSLVDVELPYIAINNMEDLNDAYTYLTTDPVGMSFPSISLDSITDIAEVCLNAEKKKTVDGRQAYGANNDIMGETVRKFRDIPGRNIYFSAQLDKVQDEKGRMLYGPSMPGKTLTQQLPYWFDIVLALRVELSEGAIVRMFQTQTDGLWQAKNRGGRLEMWEQPDLGAIIRKVKGIKDVEPFGNKKEAN